jgi:GntR family transcriptional regulator/MocR family aminotransferase
MPTALDGSVLAEAARKHGVLIEPGTPFFDDHDVKRNFFRLGVSSVSTDRIEAGVRMLARTADGLRVRC